MRSLKPRKQTLGQAIVAAAVAATVSPAIAGVSGGMGQEFVIPTTGATALRSFTSAENNRGPYLLGQGSLLIGGSTYTAQFPGGQAFGILNKATGSSGPEPSTSADRIVYQYHSTGSVNGIREVARAQGLLGTSPFPVSSSNQLFVMGQPLSSLNGAGLSNGYGSTVGASYEPIIAYSDVRADQAFRVPGTPAVNAAPTAPGYGQGRPNGLPGISFQRLTDVSELNDPADTFAAGVETLANRVRNESLAVVPFTVAASPGTGLDSLDEDDVKFLHAAGRLKNGANFNSVTRDIGSGTRNEGGNNFNIDPSWASGERDRIALVETIHFDVDGNPVTIGIGQEQSPERGIGGEATVNQNEHRPSAITRFADKTSGSTGVRQLVLSTRMSIGAHLSAGDVGDRGTSASTSSPLRIMAIDFHEDNSLSGEPAAGPVQPNFADVTEGRYQMWSASQAVTISPDGTSIGSTTAIKGDVNDGTSTGVGRKFLDNIINSIASGPNPSTAATPFDAVVAAGFIPVQAMNVDKAFDGATQFTSPRSNVEDPETGFSEEEIWQALSGAAVSYHRAGDHNGNIAGQSYRIWDVGTGTNSGSAGADVQIPFTARTFLAGDMNGDSVRDLADVPALAQAYANTSGYLSANPAVTTGSATALTGKLDTSAMTSEGHFGLLALTDLNGDGNVEVIGDYGFDGGANPKDKVVAVSRADVKYFLYGASIDTTSANPATGYAGSANAQTRRELGVRLGQLRKNAAIDTFNATLDGYVGAVANPATGLNYTQGEIDALKFNKFDVNGDGVANCDDAKIVDRNVGADYTSLAHVLGTNDDLIAAELNDNNVITHVLSAGTSDMKLIREALGGQLLNGDTNFDGTVDITDLGTLATAWQTSVDRWSFGDFDFNGVVDITDLGALATNWQQTGAGFTEALASVSLGSSSVPEPASLGAVALGVGAMIRRRRR